MGRLALTTCLLLMAAPSLGQTHVASDISASQTWTAAGSPYLVDARVTIRPDVSLDIEPDVVVKFTPGQTGLVMAERSTLRAAGTADAPIIFTSASMTPAPGDYLGLSVGHAGTTTIMNYCTVEFAQAGLVINAPIETTEIEVRYCQNGVVSLGGYGAARASKLRVHENNVGVFVEEFSVADLSQCRIYENDYGMNGMSGNIAISLNACDVSNNRFGGAMVEYGTASGCTFAGNGAGGLLVGRRAIVTGCNIVGNTGPGLVVGPMSPGGFCRVNVCNIRDNSPFDLVVDSRCGLATVDAANNWWGVSDPGAVAGRIWDRIDDPAISATVTYLPMEQQVGYETTAWGSAKAMYR